MEFNKENFEFITYHDKRKSKKRKLVMCKKGTNEYKQISKINKILIKNKKVVFNNKNKIFTNLYKIVKNNINNYTVVLCDFKDFGHSLNINYCLEKCDIKELLNREENEFLQKYANFIKNCKGGISINTTLAQIILSEFDKNFKDSYEDIAFYERYADDIFVIFNSILNKQDVEERFNKIVNNIFYDKEIGYFNKTKLHFDKKFVCFNSNSLPNSFDFLGINLTFDKTVTFNITKNDIVKVQEQIKKLILTYKNNEKALRLALNIVAKGIVYKKIKNNKEKWIFKGLASKCRFLLRFDNCALSDTFYRDILIQIFKDMGIKIPNYIYDDAFDMVKNVKNRRFFVLDKKSGLTKNKLIEIMQILGYNFDENEKYFVIAKKLIDIF